MTKNVSVSESWLKNVGRLISQAQGLCEAARDGRNVPEWLQERLRTIEQLLEEL